MKNNIILLKEKIIQIYKLIYEKITLFIKSIIYDFTIIDIEEGRIRYSLHWWLMKSLKWITAVILAVITMLLWGCSSSFESVKYYPVNIPVKCEIEHIESPEYSDDIIETNLNILHYASKLREALDVCTQGGIYDRKSI